MHRNLSENQSKDVSKSECNIVHETLSQNNSADVPANLITELKDDEHKEPSVIGKGTRCFNIFECSRNILDQLDVMYQRAFMASPVQEGYYTSPARERYYDQLTKCVINPNTRSDGTINNDKLNQAITDLKAEEEAGHERNINGFTPSLGSKTLDAVDAAIEYECEFTGKALIMIIRNELHLKEMKQNLLSPFITRLAGLEVNEQPKFMTRNPTTKHHSVCFKENDIRIHILIKGIVSFIPTRKPTQEEYLNIGKRLELTPPFTEWDPHNTSYGISKNCMLDHDGNINSNINIPEDPTVENPAIRTCEVGVISIMTSISPTLEPWSLSSDFEGEFGICGVSPGEKKYPIT